MKKKGLYIIIGCLLILNINMYFNIKRIENNVNRVMNSIERVENEVRNMESSVQNTMNKIYNEKQWLYNERHEFMSIDEDFKIAKVNFSWSLRELDKEHKVYISYGRRKNGKVEEWNEVLAKDLGNLNYNANLKLSGDSDYDVKVVAKNENNIISERLESLELASAIEDRLNIDMDFIEKSNRKGNVILKFRVEVGNRLDYIFKGLDDKLNKDKLRLKDIKVNVYSNDEPKKEIEIFKDGKIIHEKASIYNPFEFERDMEFKRIEYDDVVEYESTQDSYEDIEVIITDYLGRTYKKKTDYRF
ncbi:hypothetical protein [Anaeromicrobium sediminis]|uniref:Uncharacterized protein n=1 Tax=Anaeromicrobium sediminis TaxID=1478221 RepID=A0A267MB07_9FIRM|nr:hypothetical protein [Anaeromicrobium sediminis]PAB56736.1 hypothetical protein CCE28_20520 [Anaeromicrobium sediminis]